MRVILSYTINFNKEDLKNIEDDIKEVRFTPDQLKVIQEFSKFICKIIKLPEHIIEGNIWRALKEWQIRNKKVIVEIGNMPIIQKLNAVKEIFSIGRSFLKKMVSEPKEKSFIIIDIAYEKAFKYYLEFFTKNFA